MACFLLVDGNGEILFLSETLSKLLALTLLVVGAVSAIPVIVYDGINRIPAMVVLLVLLFMYLPML